MTRSPQLILEDSDDFHDVRLIKQALAGELPHKGFDHGKQNLKGFDGHG